MPRQPIVPGALAQVLLDKFSEMGFVETEGSGDGRKYYLTNRGRLLLANFGIEEKNLY